MHEWEQRHSNFRKACNADQVERNAVLNKRSAFEFGANDETLSDEIPDLMNETDGELAFQKRDLVTEEVVGGAAEIIQNRQRDLGDLYPFRVTSGGVEYLEKADAWVYKFCLFASLADTFQAHRQLRACFELIALDVLVAFVGAGSGGMRTGHPWDIYSGKFRSSKEVFANLQKQCGDQLDWEWGPASDLPNDPSYKNTKDLGLDVVVWKKMPDSRGGSHYYLGQCATGGSDLERKASELSLKSLSEWMRLPDAEATRSIITPYYLLHQAQVRQLSKKGGLVFDRSRIVRLLSSCGFSSSSSVKDCQELLKIVETN